MSDVGTRSSGTATGRRWVGITTMEECLAGASTGVRVIKSGVRGQRAVAGDKFLKETKAGASDVHGRYCDKFLCCDFPRRLQSSALRELPNR
jgi:hypothetical protein